MSKYTPYHRPVASDLVRAANELLACPQDARTRAELERLLWHLLRARQQRKGAR